MDATLANEIADEWITKWSSKANLDCARLDDSRLAVEEPVLFLASIVAALRKIQAPQPDKLMAALAAGPLEDLLTNSGEVVVDRVELLARQEVAFRVLLNGVWGSGVKSSVLEKLAKYRTQPW